MKYALLIIFATLYTLSASGQSGGSLDDKMKMKHDVKSYSWFYKNIFISNKFSVFTEYLIFPKINYTTLNDFENPYSLEEEIQEDGGYLMSPFTYTLEPRINIISGKKSSLSLRMPIGIGLSFINRNSNIVKNGAFHVTLPVLLGYTRGINSTYDNTDRFGFSVSAGMQLVKTSLLGGGFETYFIEDNLLPTSFDIRNDWIMPLLQFEYYYRKEDNKIHGVSLAISPGTGYIKLSKVYELSKK